mmetsp:Transcript_54067/g.115465  ORF Transcript_54067/g.115465 Transcript_54067/m.115465 type:complete len:244 (-) Transcript_54067:365-1096(-)
MVLTLSPSFPALGVFLCFGDAVFPDDSWESWLSIPPSTAAASAQSSANFAVARSASRATSCAKVGSALSSASLSRRARSALPLFSMAWALNSQSSTIVLPNFVRWLARSFVLDALLVLLLLLLPSSLLSLLFLLLLLLLLPSLLCLLLPSPSGEILPLVGRPDRSVAESGELSFFCCVSDVEIEWKLCSSRNSSFSSSRLRSSSCISGSDNSRAFFTTAGAKGGTTARSCLTKQRRTAERDRF